jgi:hypothetical protein
MELAPAVTLHLRRRVVTLVAVELDRDAVRRPDHVDPHPAHWRVHLRERDAGALAQREEPPLDLTARQRQPRLVPAQRLAEAPAARPPRAADGRDRLEVEEPL